MIDEALVKLSTTYCIFFFDRLFSKDSMNGTCNDVFHSEVIDFSIENLKEYLSDLENNIKDQSSWADLR